VARILPSRSLESVWAFVLEPDSGCGLGILAFSDRSGWGIWIRWSGCCSLSDGLDPSRYGDLHLVLPPVRWQSGRCSALAHIDQRPG